jgi:hypothetical protein
MTSSSHAVTIARRWLSRADLNPHGELAIVAKAFINETNQRNDSSVEPIELPSWPFYSKAEANAIKIF